MTEREKLIQIIDSSRTYVAGKESLADHLLDNGVTFQKWIPVSERLPERGQEVIVYTGGVLKPVVMAYQFWNKDYDSWLRVTHWMPLPEPPKEDN